GGTTISSGVVDVSSNTDNQLGTGTITLGSATLKYSNTVGLVSTKPFTLSGASIIQNDAAGAVTLNGAISGAGSLQKTGSGTLTLGAANTYQGGTTISSGILSISSNENLGSSSSALNIGAATLFTTSSFTS